MPDETPKVPPQAPPDPFAPDHTGFVAALHFYRGLRAAGAAMAEAAIIVGGIVRAGGDEEPPKPGA